MECSAARIGDKEMESLSSKQLLALYFDYVSYRDSVKNAISVKEYFETNKDKYNEA
jgi:hypothetical protein